MEKVERKLSYL